MLKILRLETGLMKTNCYIVYDDSDSQALIIDPGDDADFIIDKIKCLFLEPFEIVSTHGHFDHNMAVFELQKSLNIPFCISEKDLSILKNMSLSAEHYLNISNVYIPKPDNFIRNNSRINLTKSYFKVIEIPGHTPGSIALYNPFEKIIFSGDTIFKDGVCGRYDFSYSNKNDLDKSIAKVLALPSDTQIYPGHGEMTTVKKEREYYFD